MQNPPHPVKDYKEHRNVPPILVWPTTEQATENDRWCVEMSHPDYDGMACTVGMPEERGSITLVEKFSREETAAESDESVTNEKMDISSEADDEQSADGDMAETGTAPSTEGPGRGGGNPPHDNADNKGHCQQPDTVCHSAIHQTVGSRQ